MSRTEQINARHWKVGGGATVYPEQCVCGLAWPCDAAYLLARVAELEGAMSNLLEWAVPAAYGRVSERFDEALDGGREVIGWEPGDAEEEKA